MCSTPRVNGISNTIHAYRKADCVSGSLLSVVLEDSYRSAANGSLPGVPPPGEGAGGTEKRTTPHSMARGVPPVSLQVVTHEAPW